MAQGCIALFGGSGATGRAVVEAATARGWKVQGLVRRTGSLVPAAETVQEIVGALADEAAVSRTLAGSSATIITLGPRPPFRDVFCADATRAVVRAMRTAGIGRLVCLTGALIGEYPENRSALFRCLGRVVGRRTAPSMADRALQETLVHESGLRWTIVKPPRLTDGPLTRRVVKGPHIRVGLLSAISRRDLAEVLLDLCASDEAVAQALFVRAG